MKKQFIIASIAAVLILGMSSKGEKKSTSEKNVFKIHTKLYKSQSILNIAATQFINDRKAKLDKYMSTLKALKSGNQQQINNQINNFERNIKYANNSLKYAEKNYKKLKKQNDELKFDKAKVGEVEGLEKKRFALIAQIKKKKLPFEEKKSKFVDRIDRAQRNQKLKDLLLSIYPEKAANGITPGSINVTFKDAFASCRWTKEKKQIAWAHFRLRPVSQRSTLRNKLNGKYSISSINNNSIWLWVGNFYICLVIDDKSLQGKENVKKTAIKLLNLQELEKASEKKIVKNAISTYEFFEQLRKDSNAAANTLLQKRYKLDRQISKLSKEGYKSTAETAKLKTRFEKAENKYKNYKKDIIVYKDLIKMLKSAQNMHKKIIAELNKKCSEQKDEIIDYFKKLKKNRAQLRKDIDFSIVNKEYKIQASKFARMPKSREFMLINRVSTDAYLGSPRIKCQWTMDISPQNRSVFSGNITYYPNYPISSNKGMVDNKYVIHQLSNYSITLKVGDFLVTMTPHNRSFYSKDMFIKAVKELYDLDAIAKATK